ncbi:MAG: heterodisulfide reductase-related iron-sulfur binding cluster [Bacteroidales bacterium]|nr:heterodisulfide reductase-related iron-sulfur binding cluster [Bacteroidales bacterium]MDY6348533.1 heterodisulfide reductase-related iron-sulfur binding cluster [Bacteroidales bacterium]
MEKRYWNEYVKDIADDHFFYERSCIRQTFFPGSEAVFLKILRNDLGKDIYDSSHQHTCTGIGYHSDVVPYETTMTIVARLFSLMTEHGYKNYIPSCITSFGLMTELIETWKENPDILDKARGYLMKATGRSFELPENIAHPSDVFFKFRHELKAKMKYQLVNRYTGNPLRGVDHIGCHYAKIFPKHGIGNAEFPHVLAGMVEAWGGEVIDYPERRHCCGFGFRQYLVQENRGYSIANSKKKFESMEPYEPDFIVSNCPGCAMFLDKWQYTIAEMEHKTYDRDGYGIPVFTYEELAGILLGYDPWTLGLQLHQVQCERFLNKIGVEYNPDEKYKGASGKLLRAPEKPQILKV